jgi:hypothetical protein
VDVDAAQTNLFIEGTGFGTIAPSVTLAGCKFSEHFLIHGRPSRTRTHTRSRSHARGTATGNSRSSGWARVGRARQEPPRREDRPAPEVHPPVRIVVPARRREGFNIRSVVVPLDEAQRDNLVEERALELNLSLAPARDLAPLLRW